MGEKGKDRTEECCTEKEQWKEVGLTNICLKVAIILGEGEDGQLSIPRQDTPSKTAHRLQGYTFGKVDISLFQKCILDITFFWGLASSLLCYHFTLLPFNPRSDLMRRNDALRFLFFPKKLLSNIRVAVKHENTII